jgi:hypothetical protein
MSKLIMWNLMTLDGFYEGARSFDLPLSADQLRTLDGASHIALRSRLWPPQHDTS